MTGTEKILRHIAAQAEEESGKILAAARDEIGKIEARSAAETENIRKNGEAKAEALMADARSRSEAALAMKKRRELLAVKGRLIREAVDKAYSRLTDLPDGEYFAFLNGMLKDHIRPGDGVLLLNRRDLARLPEDFAAGAKAMAEAKGGSLALSDEPADIDGGFILRYGGIEENCSLKAVFAERADDLKDAVREVLFGA